MKELALRQASVARADKENAFKNSAHKRNPNNPGSGGKIPEMSRPFVIPPSSLNTAAKEDHKVTVIIKALKKPTPQYENLVAELANANQGDTACVVSRFDPIVNIKKWIAQLPSKVPKHEQRLLLNGKALLDYKALFDYNITDKTQVTIQLVLIPNASMPAIANIDAVDITAKNHQPLSGKDIRGKPTKPAGKNVDESVIALEWTRLKTDPQFIEQFNHILNIYCSNKEYIPKVSFTLYDCSVSNTNNIVFL